MRITENMRSAQTIRGVGELRVRHQAASEEVTTGISVNRPSDDPTVASRLTRIERAKEQSKSMSSAIALGRSDLELAESVLAEAGSLIQRAQEVAMTAANGSASADVRSSAAAEIEGIRTALLGLANTKGVRGYIFAGSKTDQPAFDGTYTFQGDTYEHSIRSGPTSEAVISASGADAFTSLNGGRDIFQDLDNLHTSMITNSQPGIMGELDHLVAAHDQIVLERARTGVNITRIEQNDTILTNSRFLYDKQEADLAGVDPAESYSKFTLLEQSIQRSLLVAQQMLSLDAFSITR